jgi:hypothetical protein
MRIVEHRPDELSKAVTQLAARARERLGNDVDTTAIGVRWHRFDCKQVEVNSGTEIEGIATTDSIDCDDEVVLPSGVDWSVMRSSYKAMYADHMYGVENIVATLRNVNEAVAPDGSVGWKVRARMMPDAYSPRVTQVKELAARGAVGLSIGFVAIDRGKPTREESELYPGARSIVRKARVFEVSFTAMPCNLSCSGVAVVDEGKASVMRELVRKGQAPVWAARMFIDRPVTRVAIIAR